MGVINLYPWGKGEHFQNESYSQINFYSVRIPGHVLRKYPIFLDSLIPRILHKMQLPINTEEFGFPNLELYNHTYLLSNIKYWKPRVGVNFPIWTTLEFKYILPLIEWMV